MSATSGEAAEREAQRPLQHPCSCAAIGIEVQQMDIVTTTKVITAPIAVSRIHLRLFTRNNVRSGGRRACDAWYVEE
jgi:hypothetical protein